MPRLEPWLNSWITIYHHELRTALPQQPSAALELRIHAGRSFVSGALSGSLFAGLAWLAWGGAWLVLLAAMLLTEVVLTLWNFLAEDRSCILPPVLRPRSGAYKDAQSVTTQAHRR